MGHRVPYHAARLKLALHLSSRAVKEVTCSGVATAAFTLPRNLKVSGFLDLFSLFNTNAERNTSLNSGTSFVRPLNIIPPRFARIGARITF